MRRPSVSSRRGGLSRRTGKPSTTRVLPLRLYPHSAVGPAPCRAVHAGFRL